MLHVMASKYVGKYSIPRHAELPTIFPVMISSRCNLISSILGLNLRCCLYALFASI